MPEWMQAEVAAGLTFTLECTAAGLRTIRFKAERLSGVRNEANSVLAEAARQLSAYFAGDLRVFDVPLDMSGTPFQKRVWTELLNIPYGETRSYASIAAALGSPNYVRAVGAANGANPVPIIVPCHRVIGAGGKLVGYGGGLELKKRLLEIEGRKFPAPLFS